MATPTYKQSRALVLGAGLAVLIATAIVLQINGTDRIEIYAVLLFLPVFVAAVLGGIGWGVGAALLATAGYALLRLDAIQLTPGLIYTRLIARSIGYVAFGALGGWAAGVVGGGITKLDRFDVTDDDSELLNARGVHRQLAQEVARAARYNSDFAVVTVSFALTGDKKEVRQRIGDVVRRSVRTVDDTARITMDGRDVLIAVLPETPRAGAEVVGRKVAEALDVEAAQVDADVRWLTHPEDNDEIATLLAALEEVVRRDHPEAVS
jgi:hypothetical protein